MLTASNRGAGMNIGFPDVCLTPVGPVVVPIPYPNFGAHATAVAFSPIVKVSGVHALNLGSTIPATFGDEPGVAHWTVKGPGQFVMGNPIVFIDGLPAINLTCPTTGNTGNNAVGAVLVPAATNVFYTYDHPRRGAPSLSSADAVALGDEVLGRGEARPLSWRMLGESVGVVRVRLFTTDLASRFHVAVDALAAEGARALVLDVRGCRGGDLDAAIALAERFLDGGAEIVRIEDAEGDELVRRASLPASYTMPLVLLVDGDTASAAEVFAAALKAHGRASLVGDRTHGKGRAEALLAGQEHAFEPRTICDCRAPGGAPIHGVGVVPDVPLRADAVEGMLLDAALEVLR